MSKSEKTKAYIIETVAPIFNKNGFSAMSLSKITEATGLTKGAIYGHFTNKEELAVEAYKFSVRRVLKDMNKKVNEGKTPLEMLLKLAAFYETYYEYNIQYGGCPILNIGVDSGHQNTIIAEVVRSYNTRILDKFSQLVEKGKESGELREEVNSMQYAKRFFYMVEGAVYMAFIMQDKSYLLDLSATMEQMILNEMKQ
ncbi:TetR/AcrR family transcriptional regulator [Tenacibaculum sp. 190524A02b]|uniref:TetR/AcrR family transcriptional regulator, transcriptional repressor for nem operon n=1 Tax=Tenacibaculum vairaonense TaxID=3137860 RepID=A0ABM9PJG7_9FLAO